MGKSLRNSKATGGNETTEKNCFYTDHQGNEKYITGDGGKREVKISEGKNGTGMQSEIVGKSKVKCDFDCQKKKHLNQQLSTFSHPFTHPQRQTVF